MLILSFIQKEREQLVSQKLEKLSLGKKSNSDAKMKTSADGDKTSINETVAPTEQTKLIKKENAEVVCPLNHETDLACRCIVQGSVSWAVYKAYFSACGNFIILLLVLTYIMTYAASSMFSLAFLDFLFILS